MKRTHEVEDVVADDDDEEEEEEEEIVDDIADDDEDDSDNEDDFDEMNVDDDDDNVDGTIHPQQLTNRNGDGDAKNDAFFDSFYGISSSDVRERAMAAKVLIQHCLLSSPSTSSTTTAQMKDATYALRRLTNGLCSGRAAARQGNAATLASFIQIAISLGHVPLIRHEWFSKDRIDDVDGSSSTAATTPSSPPQSDLSFIRHALLSATEPTKTTTGKMLNSTGGKRRGGGNGNTNTSEERDYKLGRLFGITAIVRSGIIQQLLFRDSHASDSTASSTTRAPIETDVANLVNDLVQIYMYKKWIREAVAHALCSLLYALQDPHPSDNNNNSKNNGSNILSHVVEQIIIPLLLCRGDNTITATAAAASSIDQPTQSFIDVVSSYSAEQIAIAVCIQSIMRTTTTTTNSLLQQLPHPLNQTILCTETIPYFVPALCATASSSSSSTVSQQQQQPRNHFVWDMILEYVTESASDTMINTATTTKGTSVTNTSKTKSSSGISATLLVDDRCRRFNDSSPQLPDGDNVNDLVGAIVTHVIVEGLLGISATNNNTVVPAAAPKTSNKITQDRYTLALSLIRNLMGVEFTTSIVPQRTSNNSANSSSVRLMVTSEQMENIIFTPTIVQHLFFNVICTGNKSKPNVNKSLAIDILEQVVDTLLDDTTRITKQQLGNDTDAALSSGDDIAKKRLTMAFILLRCDARFDSKTKTSTVERLIGSTTTTTTTITTNSNVPEGDGPVDGMDNVIFKATWKPYLTFLEHQIISNPSQNLKIKTKYETQGYIDLLYQLGKTLSRHDNIVDSESTTRIYGLLLAVAFFDCSNIEAAESTGMVPQQKKKDKKRHSVPSSQSNPIIDIARMIQESRSELNASPTLSYEVRAIASARFFSLIADSVTTTIHSSSLHKESNIINLFSNLNSMQTHLLSTGAKKIVTVTPSDDMDTETDVPPDIIVSKMIDDARNGNKSDSNKDASAKWKNGCAILASTLYLHLLSCGHPDVSNDENIDPNADDDEDYEETVGLLNDLHSINASNFTPGKMSDDAPLPALAELCANILSSPLGVGNQSRGASPTLLRDAVKMAWTGGLTLSASLTEDDTSAINEEILNILLNAIGAIDDTIRDHNDDDDEDDDEGESDDDENDTEGSTLEKFTSVTDINELHEELTKDDSDGDKDDDEDDDEELQIDPEKLKSLLEEESDADIDERELEHHEGADAALAKLIQLKQQARKAGALARERTEIARQSRCFVLLETLVVGRESNWGSLLRIDHITQLMLPILKYRIEIVKSLAKANSKGPSAGSNDKAALVGKLTTLLKNKILKAKISDMEWTESIDVADASTTFVNAALKHALDSEDKEHRSLCNSCIMFVLRGVSDSTLKLKSAAIYSDAVLQWSTKRTTRLDSTFFEGLIHQCPVIAQACLTDALATAATNGRTAYLKSESFRLLSTLYNPKLNAAATDFDRVALDILTASTTNVLASIASSFNDAEMKKTKRIRDVLKAAEKVIHFLSVSTDYPANCLERLNDMTEMLHQLKSDSESHGIANAVTTLLSCIDSLVAKTKGRPANDSVVPMDDEDDPVQETDVENEATDQEKLTSKKKKNKSKKKKK